MHEILEISQQDSRAATAGQAISLERFCSEAGRLLATVSVCDIPRVIAGLLPGLLLQPDLLSAKHKQAPAGTYGRNALFVCPRDAFSVLAMVWPPGVSTPVHDHRDWCALGVYEGLIEETRYKPAPDTADRATVEPFETICHRAGDVAYLPVDAPNIHRIHNPTDKTAISIHVYGGNCEIQGPNLGRIYSAS